MESSTLAHAIDALVFDAYGTLFDVHSVSQLAEELVPGQGFAVSNLWRAKQLEYSWLVSVMAMPRESRSDFDAITAQALDFALASLRIELGDAERHRLRDAYLTLRPFPDAVGALDALASRPRWILSNGTLAMLQPLIRNAGLEARIDGVLSVDAAGIFKPSPRVYQLAIDRLRLPAARIGFVSSNCWDAIGAKAFGFKTFWINRREAAVDRHASAPDFTLSTLAELPPLLAR